MPKEQKEMPTSRIATSIERLITKNGLEKTADILETVSIGNTIQFDKLNIDLQKFILTETIKEFRISASSFDKSKSEAYKKARCTCFFLYNKYCHLSPQKILQNHKKFIGTRTRVGFAIKKMEQIVAMPNIDKQHYALHIKITEKVISFIDASKK